MDPDLVGRAAKAGQQDKLFSLVHGIVGTGHHHPIPGPPAFWLVGELQDAAVGQHVDGNGGLRTNYRGRQGELELTECTFTQAYTQSHTNTIQKY